MCHGDVSPGPLKVRQTGGMPGAGYFIFPGLGSLSLSQIYLFTICTVFCLYDRREHQISSQVTMGHHVVAGN